MSVYVAEYAREYRSQDDAVVRSVEFAHHRGCLRALAAGLRRPYRALELGCGTGRFFHCLSDASEVVGLDASTSMLEQARSPVAPDGAELPPYALVRGDALAPPRGLGVFDLVFSIGVVGEHAPFDAVALAAASAFVAPGGALFFTVVDRDGRTEPDTLRRRLARTLHPLLPAGARRVLESRWRGHALTRAELEAALRAGPLESFEVTRRVSEAAEWVGAHFEVVVRRPA